VIKLAKFRAILGIPRGETAKVKKVCSDIKKRDPSFFYEIFKPTVPDIREKFENLLFLYSSSKADVMHRAGWFLHKCKNARVSNYFWVKKV
jgi:hypothetical protein